jgi:ADP-ribose pyrophosphatase YjhB (NUDIX family)
MMDTRIACFISCRVKTRGERERILVVLNNNNKWMLPGGYLDFDTKTKKPKETKEECVLRELREESGDLVRLEKCDIIHIGEEYYVIDQPGKKSYLLNVHFYTTKKIIWVTDDHKTRMKLFDKRITKSETKTYGFVIYDEKRKNYKVETFEKKPQSYEKEFRRGTEKALTMVFNFKNTPIQKWISEGGPPIKDKKRAEDLAIDFEERYGVQFLSWPKNTNGKVEYDGLVKVFEKFSAPAVIHHSEKGFRAANNNFEVWMYPTSARILYGYLNAGVALLYFKQYNR